MGDEPAAQAGLAAAPEQPAPAAVPAYKRLDLSALVAKLKEWVKMPKGFEKNSVLAGFDAGFGSVRLGVAFGILGMHMIAGVKGIRSGFPKAWLAEKMKNMPSGNWITLACAVEGVELVAMGYKYNRRKVLHFIMTKSAGSPVAGAPYIATFNDSHGNSVNRKVPRPVAISRFFARSSAIDAHNHMRQKLLALEKAWITQNPWFRFTTTLVGITVIDSYLVVRSTVHDKHSLGGLTVSEYEQARGADDGQHAQRATRSAEQRSPTGRACAPPPRGRRCSTSVVIMHIDFTF